MLHISYSSIDFLNEILTYLSFISFSLTDANCSAEGSSVIEAAPGREVQSDFTEEVQAVMTISLP